MAGSKTLHCSIVTPDRLLVEVDASMVVVPGHDDGDIGILPGHAAYLGNLGIGVVRIETSEGGKRFGVYGGFVQVDHDQVTVLANRAESPEEVTEESLALEREKLEECDTRSDEGFSEGQRLARRIRVRAKMLRGNS